MRIASMGAFLLLLSTIGVRADDQSVACVKLADCAQRLVEIATRLQEQNRLLSDRVKALETIQSSVVAFALDTCPSGWEPYHLAEGRFIRGVDPAHPDRGLGSVQEDAFQGHTFGDGAGRYLKYSTTIHSGGTPSGYSDMWDTGIFGNNPAWVGGAQAAIVTDNQNGSPRVAGETRPKNVSLLFCRKN